MVYVDQIMQYPSAAVATSARKHGARWCHLWADYGDEVNLHQIAAAIGLKREWFQREGRWFPHYDLVPGKRLLAIRAGAHPRDMKDWISENYNRILEFKKRQPGGLS